MLEEPRAQLHAQDAAHGVVDALHRQLALADELLSEVGDVRAHHLRVDAGVERDAGGVRAVGGDAVAARALVRVARRARAELGDGGVVALDEAVEAPPALEDVRHELAVRARGNGADRVEPAHDGVRTGVDRCLERREVQVPEALDGDVGRVVVAPALRLAVGGHVLRARHDLVGGAVVAALQALHACGGHGRAEVRILARALGDPAPPGLVGHVDHRAVRLLDADGGGLAGADRGVGGRDVGIEAAGLRQRDREGRPVAVDRVVREQDRDLQP
jgi:hypothetical protein